MFLSHRTLGLLGLLLLGLIFGLSWHLSRNPSRAELTSGAKEALSALLSSFDEDHHFIHRTDLQGSPLSVTREEQFTGELSAATALARASRGETSLAEHHRLNLHIILKDWYTENPTGAYLANGGTLSMEQNGQALVLLSASPLFEEERPHAEMLARPIHEWAKRTLSAYWRGASTSPSVSVGHGILGLSALYARTGSPELRDSITALAERYRLLLDNSALRLHVSSALYKALANEEDMRDLLLTGEEYLPLQDKNIFSKGHGLFKDPAGGYFPIAEQSMIVEGLAQAAAHLSKTHPSDAALFKDAALRGARALLTLSDERGTREYLDGTTVSAYATARTIEALKELAK